MISEYCQKAFEGLLQAGNICDAHDFLMKEATGKRLPFRVLSSWLEIASCTGIARIDDILDRTDRRAYNETEISIIDSYRAIAYWLDFDVLRMDALFKEAIGRSGQERSSLEAIHAQAHQKLCARLLMFRLQHPAGYQSISDGKLFVIGDSHSLVMAGRSMGWLGQTVNVISLPIRGIKMFHLGAGSPAKYRSYFVERLKLVPCRQDLILSIGEIDCRPNEGIFHQVHRAGNIDLNLAIDKTVASFTEYVLSALRHTSIIPRSVTLMGIPKPGYSIAPGLPANTTPDQFLAFVDAANSAMFAHARRVGWHFFDLAAATKRFEGQPASGYRLDGFHLMPHVYDEAERWLRVA